MDRVERILHRVGWVCAAAFLVCVLFPLRDGLDGWARRLAELTIVDVGWCGNSFQRLPDKTNLVIDALPLFVLPFVVAGCLARHPVAKFVCYTVPVAMCAGLWLFLGERFWFYFPLHWNPEYPLCDRGLERHAVDAGVLLCAIGALGIIGGDGRRRWKMMVGLGLLVVSIGLMESVPIWRVFPSVRIVRWGAVAACGLFYVTRPDRTSGLAILTAAGLCLSVGMIRSLGTGSWGHIETETRFFALALLEGLALAWFLLWSWELEEPPVQPLTPA